VYRRVAGPDEVAYAVPQKTVEYGEGNKAAVQVSVPKTKLSASVAKVIRIAHLLKMS
jgi:hypothetical protein